MMNTSRRLVALLLCLLLTCMSAGALAAAKVSKTFTQKPTLKVSLGKGAYSGEYATYTVTPSVPGFLTVQLLTSDGNLVLVLEDHTEVHTKGTSV